MCVDIGYKASLGKDGLPKYIPGVKINKNIIDKDEPHLQAHARPLCKVVVAGGDGGYQVEEMSWGVVMDFMQADADALKKYGNSMFNARGEKLLTTPSVWNKLINNRCLLIADGIYEHQQVDGYKKKIPHYISLSSGAPMLLPCVFAPALPGYTSATFAVVTGPANELMKKIHNDGPNKHRMPVFGEPEFELNWLNKNMVEKEINEFTNYAIPSASLKSKTVFTIRGNAIREDGKEKNDFFDWGINEQSSLF
jgi:putative SOS response-associated peptidase YedK